MPNISMLINILIIISLHEEPWACNQIVKRDKRFLLKKLDTKEERVEQDMELYYHSLYSDPKNPFHKKYIQHMSSIDFSSDWKSAYNSIFFDSIDSKSICFQYLKCLKWTLLYYTSSDIPSWEWVYPFRNAPLCSTFLQYLINHQYNFTTLWNSITFTQGNPLSPIEQLLAVSPPQHSNILPFAANMLMRDPSLEFMYPRTVELDVIKGQKNIYSEPLLHPIDIKAIKQIMAKIPFTKSEIARNKQTNKLFMHIKNT